MTEEQQQRINELAKKFGWLMSEVRNEIDGKDPRSFDLCLARMEEAQMWANKGILARGDNGQG